MKVAILGMGRMGQSLALRLLETGHEVSIWNRTPGKADDVTDAGGRECKTIEDAVSDCEAALVSLAADDAVHDVVLGNQGVAAHLADAVYVETSTISPAFSAQLAEQVPRFVAMPIVGSPDAVRAGKATYLLGGESAIISVLEPLLADLAVARHVYPVQRLANVAKLTGNALLLTAIIGLAECITIGRAGGLSDQQLSELLVGSPIIGDGVKNRLDAVIDGTGPTWWTVALGVKDARLALELLSDDPGTDLPTTASVRAQYAAAASRGLADSDIAEVIRLYQHES
jgi:3-hydroxyisobutyrate dehydrogenase-like beta-hydroxyacid dehydrogenase